MIPSTHSAVHHKIHGTPSTYAQRACALPCQAAGNSQADKPASTAQYRVTQVPNLKTHSKTGPTTSTVLGFLAQSAVNASQPNCLAKLPLHTGVPLLTMHEADKSVVTAPAVSPRSSILRAWAQVNNQAVDANTHKRNTHLSGGSAKQRSSRASSRGDCVCSTGPGEPSY